MSLNPALRLRLAAIAVVLLLVALTTWRLWPAPEQDRKDNSVPVQVTTANAEAVTVFLSGLGAVQSPHEVVIRPQIDGQLASLHFREGQDVQRGDLLAVIDDRSIRARLAQATADRQRASSELKQAERDLERYRNLQKTSAIAVQAVGQQETLVEQSRAALAAAEAALASAETDLSHTRIRSPVSGRAGLRRIDAGNIVRATDTAGIVTITQIHPVAVVFSLPQEALPQLRTLGRTPTAPVEVFDRSGGKVLATGTLETLDNRVDAASGTVRLKAMFANTDEVLLPGQSVSVRLTAGQLSGNPVVPAAAVQRGREGRYVWRVADGKAAPAFVTLLHEDDRVAVIASGLAIGDTIVTDGQLRLKPGASVRLITDTATGSGDDANTGTETGDAARAK